MNEKNFKMWNVTKMNNKVVVIKYGGSSMVNKDSIAGLLKQVVDLNKLGIKVILVHGGGPEISSLMERLNKKPCFVEGLRVTDEETLDIAKMALIGRVNKEIVSIISSLGGTAVGLSGIDGNLLKCTKKFIKKYENGETVTIDGGFIGKVVEVNTHLLEIMASNNLIPVVAPIGIGSNGENFNINGDDAASAIACAMGAEIFALVSDVDGVYRDIKDKSSKIDKLNISQAEQLITDGIVKGGMIPKIKCSVNAVKNGVKSVFIVSSLTEGSLLRSIVNDDMTGTIIEA